MLLSLKKLSVYSVTHREQKKFKHIGRNARIHIFSLLVSDNRRSFRNISRRRRQGDDSAGAEKIRANSSNKEIPRYRQSNQVCRKQKQSVQARRKVLMIYSVVLPSHIFSTLPCKRYLPGNH